MRATMVDDIFVRFEDAVRQPIVADELPNVLRGIEFGAFRRQGDDGDVGRENEFFDHMPAGPVDDESRMRVRGDVLADFRKQ